MSKKTSNQVHESIDAKSYRNNKLIRFLSQNPITIAIILVVVAASLLVVVRAATPRKSVRFSLSSSATDSGVTFTAPTPPPPSSTGSILLPNTLELTKYKMNVRADVADPPEVLGENITNGSYSSTGGNGSEGQFRIYCKYSHFNYDDPIVYPGQKGAAHLHMYWGNTRVDANTTKESLVTSGGGSCNGNELNRTGYWMPALNDGNGNVVIPKAMVMYYKSASVPASTITRMPQGLKMIAGNKDGNTTQTGFHNLIEWNCYDGSATWSYPNDAYGNKSGTTIPASCPAGQDLNSLVYFPQCWNGTGYNTTDVQYASGGKCPAGWKAMPQVSYHIFWPKSPTGSYANWYLSSDRMNGVNKPNGSTLHGDWYGGWKDSIMDEWIRNCINTGNNCGNGQLGNGVRSLKSFYPTDYEGPTPFLPRP